MLAFNELANERCNNFLDAYEEQIQIVDIYNDELTINQSRKVNMARRISNSAYYAKTEKHNRRFRIEMLEEFKHILEEINKHTHYLTVESIKNINFNKRQSKFIDDRVATRIADRAVYDLKIEKVFEELNNYDFQG
jgi:hypothetical protein